MAALSGTLAMQSFNITLSLLSLPFIYVASTVLDRIPSTLLQNTAGPFLNKFTEIYPVLAMIERNRLGGQYELLQHYRSPISSGDKMSSSQIVSPGRMSMMDGI
jgi:hypothetical protein